MLGGVYAIAARRGRPAGAGRRRRNPRQRWRTLCEGGGSRRRLAAPARLWSPPAGSARLRRRRAAELTLRTRPFLILQLRPEAEAADEEFAAFLGKGGLRPEEAARIRLDLDPDLGALDLDGFAGLIVGGGPGCVSDPEAAKTPVEKAIEEAVLGLMPQIVGRDLPFLGCCYGIGILAHHLGAPVGKSRFAEPVGAADCRLTPDGRADPLLAGLPDRFRAFVGHKEAVEALPPGCAHIVAAPTCPFQMIRSGRNVYATQFHPEADAAGFELRIRIYANRGYFPPADAARLIAACRAEAVFAPERILRRFVERYRDAPAFT